MITDKNSWEETLFPASAASSRSIFLPRSFLAQCQWLGTNSSGYKFLAWKGLRGHIVYFLPK